MAKVESVWYYEASIQAKETIEDKTVEKATQKAHLQSKPSEKAKVEASDLTFKKRTIKLDVSSIQICNLPLLKVNY